MQCIFGCEWVNYVEELTQGKLTTTSYTERKKHFFHQSDYGDYTYGLEFSTQSFYDKFVGG